MIQLIGKEPLSADEIFCRLAELKPEDSWDVITRNGYWEFCTSILLDLDFRKSLNSYSVYGMELPAFLSKCVYHQMESNLSIPVELRCSLFEQGDIPHSFYGTMLAKSSVSRGDSLIRLLKKLKTLATYLAKDDYRYVPPMKMIHVHVTEFAWTLIPVLQGYEVDPYCWYTVYLPLQQFLSSEFFTPAGVKMPPSMSPMQVHAAILDAFKAAQEVGYFAGCIIQ